MESGIYEFWKKQDLQNTVSSFKNNQQDQHADFKIADLVAPLSILAIGFLIAFVVILCEFVAHRNQVTCSRRLNYNRVQINKCGPAKKLKLDKWMQKDIIKKKVKVDEILETRESSGFPMKHQPSSSSVKNPDDVLKGRESVRGSYLAMRMFKKNRKLKKTSSNVKVKFIQVQPCNPQSTSE
jgi:hypothetical protein